MDIGARHLPQHVLSYRALQARTLYKLLFCMAITFAAMYILVPVIRAVWVNPLRDPEPKEWKTYEYVDRHAPWGQDIRAKMNMADRFNVFNNKVDELVREGKIASGLGNDAKRGQEVFKRKADMWTSHTAGTSTPYFDKKVTLRGF